jgi:hypothetical protein
MAVWFAQLTSTRAPRALSTARRTPATERAALPSVAAIVWSS